MIQSSDRLFANAQFLMGVVALDGLPDSDKPEIAFAGRSNVGKSSLLNALTGRKALARTSNTPGRTQELNFFTLDGRAYLVDMPGYGYAKVSKKERGGWQKLIRAYLRGRPTLRCVFVLVDARHGLKESDQGLMTMLDETAVPYRIVLTKTDKVRREELAETVEAIEAALKSHPAAFPHPLPTSAEKGAGIEDLRACVAGILG